ncbi:hypothetical protein Tco_0041131 [Tanacetum coccineum]
MLDSQGSVLGMTPTRALKSVQDMADHSKKWYDIANNKRMGNSSSDGITAITNKVDNRPPYGERKSSLEETINKYLEESSEKQAKRDEWLRKFQESTDVNLKSRDEAIKNLYTKIGLLTNDV